MRQKYLDIVEILESRLRVGDYLLSDMPSERKLAIELGVSHMTARRAVQHLVSNGTLDRPTGKMRPARPPRHEKSNPRIAFILPAFESGSLGWIQRRLHSLMEGRGGSVRLVTYVHEADPAILDALRGDFTGCFMTPPHHPSPLLLEHMAKERRRIVTLFHDFTSVGIPCIEGTPASSVSQIIDLLTSLGHRSIDCLNTEPSNTVTASRIARWQDELKQRGLQGELHDRPVEPFEQAGLAAYMYMKERLVSQPLRATAMFCVSTPAAVGASRACYEAGIRVGHDLSLCGFGEQHMAMLNTPSITVLAHENIDPYLAQGLDWIVKGQTWTPTDLRFAPTGGGTIWQGESTGPAPVR